MSLRTDLEFIQTWIAPNSRILRGSTRQSLVAGCPFSGQPPLEWVGAGAGEDIY